MAAQGMSKATATRLNRELLDITRSPDPHFTARPLEDDLLMWHFVLHGFPSDTPYHSGCYHGYLKLPHEYPLQPPSIFMTTPNGRFATHEALCVSMTAYHTDQWNPAWTIRSILLGFFSFWPDEDGRSIGAVNLPREDRVRLAAESWDANAGDPTFRRLFPELLRPAGSGGGAEAAGAGPGAAGAARSGEAGAAEADSEAATENEPLTRIRAAPSGPGGHAGGRVGRALPERRSDAALELSAVELTEAENLVEAAAEGRQEDAAAEGGEAGPEEDREPAECWICRDQDRAEPLVQPCACRGSMSGVHASCIEDWVRRRAASVPDGRPPCCPVCRQTYSGQSEMPGMASFVRYFVCMVLRGVLQLALALAYIKAAQDLQRGHCKGWPCALEVAAMVTFSVLYCGKAAVLAASLPRFRPPPCRRLRVLVVADAGRLRLLAAEFAAGAYLVLRLAPAAAMPIVAAALLPLGRCLAHVRPRPLQLRRLCARGLALYLLATGAAFGAAVFARRLPGKVQEVFCMAILLCLVACWAGLVLFCVVKALHPLDAGLHLIVPIGAAALHVCAPTERKALILIFTAHGLLLCLALLEKLCRRRWTWRPGWIWAVAWYHSAIAWPLCNGSVAASPKPRTAEQELERACLSAVSAAWLALLSLLALCVNWRAAVDRHFRAWQQRRMAFRLGLGEAAAAAEP